MPFTLNDWLTLLEKRHPTEIELGLTRLRQVAESIGLGRPAQRVVTVAGTNGKGSCVTALYQLLSAAGLRAAAYTSPHLQVFNERISINGALVADAALCRAFATIEKWRGDVSLTYFEFTTLAAFLLMEEAGLDVAVLEVGLGGRLDAVNIIDPDIAVVTSIALDHQDWLGSELTQIAREKLAIGRSGQPMIVGEVPPEVDVEQICATGGMQLFRLDREFSLSAAGAFRSTTGAISYSDLRWGNLPTVSIACALEVWQHLDLGRPPDREALAQLEVPGRFQVRRLAAKTLVLDVAHNPAAAAHLAQKLAEVFPGAVITAVFAVMADKDIDGIIAPLRSLVKTWLLPELTGVARAALPTRILPLVPNGRALANIGEALQSAQADPATEVILVCGSFYTVGPALAWL